MPDTPHRLNAHVWQPRLRVSRIIITIRSTLWDATAWPIARATLLDAMKKGSKVQRAGWFN